jgi:hypothetical protein
VVLELKEYGDACLECQFQEVKAEGFETSLEYKVKSSLKPPPQSPPKERKKRKKRGRE